MFGLHRPTALEIAHQMDATSGLAPLVPRLLFIGGRATNPIPRAGLAHDRTRSWLGAGEQVFAAAKHAFDQWAQFDLGWTRVANPQAPIEIGQIVAVEVRSLGLWSLNLSRIVETVDTGERFGFVYSTTENHVEHGEERFLLEFDIATGAAWYDLEALSRPRSPLARLGYPITRAFQHRFARDSHRRMREAADSARLAPRG